MDKIGLEKERQRTSLYWKLRNAGMPRLLATLVARVLGCKFSERSAGVWHAIPEWEPPYFEDVLLWNGLRYVVGVRGEDGRYYVPQEAAPFLATHWAWIDSAPGDEDGEGEA